MEGMWSWRHSHRSVGMGDASSGFRAAISRRTFGDVLIGELWIEGWESSRRRYSRGPAAEILHRKDAVGRCRMLILEYLTGLIVRDDKIGGSPR